jgi:hypothetical protein
MFAVCSKHIIMAEDIVELKLLSKFSKGSFTQQPLQLPFLML